MKLASIALVLIPQFSLADTLAYKFGYDNDVALFKDEALSRFSLLEDGTLGNEDCARLLLVNVSIIIDQL